MNDIMPSLFVSHGAPDILLSEHEAVDALRAIANDLPRPNAIVTVSAHWIDDPIGITAAEELSTIHDFGGFPAALYSMQYPAKGNIKLSEDISGLLQQQGLASQLHRQRGLDHGAWIPLMIMYPDADIPVVQVSLPAATLNQLVQLGKALGPLRREGVLIMGSGGSVHNLRAISASGSTDNWAIEFERWLREAVEEKHFDWLLTADSYPPQFRRAHPTIEHYAPLVLAWAAANTNRPGRRIHHSFSYANLGMSCFQFD